MQRIHFEFWKEEKLKQTKTITTKTTRKKARTWKKKQKLQELNSKSFCNSGLSLLVNKSNTI